MDEVSANMIAQTEKDHLRHLKQRKAQMKFDCLKLATLVNDDVVTNIVERAKAYYKFVRT